MIRVDISNVWGQLALPDLLALEKEVSAAHKTLAEGTGEGNDFLGWLNLPTYEETAEMQRISQAAARIRENSEAFVVVGIGGSYLGPRAAIELMYGANHNLQRGVKGNPQIFFAGNGLSPSPTPVRAPCGRCRWKRVGRPLSFRPMWEAGSACCPRWACCRWPSPAFAFAT